MDTVLTETKGASRDRVGCGAHIMDWFRGASEPGDRLGLLLCFQLRLGTLVVRFPWQGALEERRAGGGPGKLPTAAASALSVGSWVHRAAGKAGVLDSVCAGHRLQVPQAFGGHLTAVFKKQTILLMNLSLCTIILYINIPKK